MIIESINGSIEEQVGEPIQENISKEGSSCFLLMLEEVKVLGH